MKEDLLCNVLKHLFSRIQSIPLDVLVGGNVHVINIYCNHVLNILLEEGDVHINIYPVFGNVQNLIIKDSNVNMYEDIKNNDRNNVLKVVKEVINFIDFDTEVLTIKDLEVHSGDNLSIYMNNMDNFVFNVYKRRVNKDKKDMDIDVEKEMLVYKKNDGIVLKDY